MSINPRNFGIAIGRLGRDPKVFMNRDGSKKILMSLAVRQNYKGSDGKHGVDWVDLEAFVPANAAPELLEMGFTMTDGCDEGAIASVIALLQGRQPCGC